MAVKERRRLRPGSNGSAPSPLRFERIQQLRAHEYVAEQIRRHISLRLIKPGEALPAERELAGMFGVGRPTIQHALSCSKRRVSSRRVAGEAVERSSRGRIRTPSPSTA